MLFSAARVEIEADANGETIAGAQSRSIHQAFTADPKAAQAMMSTRLPSGTETRSSPN